MPTAGLWRRATSRCAPPGGARSCCIAPAASWRTSMCKGRRCRRCRRPMARRRASPGAGTKGMGGRGRRGEYAVLGFRGAELTVIGGELTDYAVAGVAMVNSHGSIERVTIARGGTDAAVSITRADGKKPVLLLDNRISTPGTMGVHVTESAVTARGNSITGARLDAEKDMGDAFYAGESRLGSGR